jgi:uncharacterized protein involved in exopolysaccharide biosynthesis
MTNQQNTKIYTEDDTIGLVDILSFLSNYVKIIILIPTIFCSIAAIYVSFFTSPVYTSQTMIKSSTGGGGTLGQAAGIAAQFGIPIPGSSSNQKWVYPQIIKSRMIARKMVKRKFNSNTYGQEKTLTQILTYGNGEPAYSQDTLEILALEKYRKIIKVNEDGSTGIITLQLGTIEPQLSADILSAQIEELDKHQKDYNIKKTSETRQFIEGRIIEIEKELNIAEEKLKDFRQSNRRIENSPSLQLQEQRLAREVAVITGVFTTLKQQLETTKIEEVKDSDYVVIIDPPDVPLYRSSPRKKNMVVMSGLIGLSVAILLSLFIEYFKNLYKKDSENFHIMKTIFINNILSLLFIKKNLNK